MRLLDDENGEPLNHKGELAGQGRQARQTKSTEDIGTGTFIAVRPGHPAYHRW
ncbi:MAG: hypothetical protein H7138_20805 [Myxococcales bacterium]|nr:hypothetical protein [Myxococcales bacterium]